MYFLSGDLHFVINLDQLILISNMKSAKNFFYGLFSITPIKTMKHIKNLYIKTFFMPQIHATFSFL